MAIKYPIVIGTINGSPGVAQSVSIFFAIRSSLYFATSKSKFPMNSLIVLSPSLNSSGVKFV